MTSPQPISQADREAAAKIVRWQRTATSEWKGADGDEAWQFFASSFSRAIVQGIWDEHTLVQAFATHASTAREEALGEVAAWLRSEAEKQTDRASDMIEMDARLLRMLAAGKRSMAFAIERRDHLRGRDGGRG